MAKDMTRDEVRKRIVTEEAPKRGPVAAAVAERAAKSAKTRKGKHKYEV